jgi:uncharacterized membrane protein HdeD (DUF308 family)
MATQIATQTGQDPFAGIVKQGTRSVSDALLAMGITLVVLGGIAVLAPLATGFLFDILFGAILIGAGIVELMDAFRSGTWQRGALLGLAGLVTLAAGVLYIARPVVGLVALTVVFLAYLAFLGTFRIVMSVQLPRGTPGKVVSFVSGLLTLALAFIAGSELPNIGAWLVGTFIGASLIVAGVARISLALGLRRAEHVLAEPIHGGAHA